MVEMIEELHKQISQTRENLTKMKSENKVISSLQDLMREIWTHDFDSWHENDIANTLLKLSALLYALSPMVENYRMSYNISYGFRKFKGAQRYIELDERGDTVAKKNAIVEKYIKSIRDEEVYNSYVSETLKRLHEDCHNAVSVLQSVLRVKTQQQFTGGVEA